LYNALAHCSFLTLNFFERENGRYIEKRGQDGDKEKEGRADILRKEGRTVIGRKRTGRIY
jgi:hypothetical protein